MTNKKLQNITKADISNKPATKMLDPKVEAERMEKDIDSMMEKADEKSDQAREHLHKQLESASKKYLTVQGIDAAMHYGELYLSELPMTERIAIAKSVACKLSTACTVVEKILDELADEELDTLVDSIYMTDMAHSDVIEPEIIVYQLCIMDLCRNIGGAGQDIADFRKASREEIDKQIEKLAEFKSEYKLED